MNEFPVRHILKVMERFVGKTRESLFWAGSFALKYRETLLTYSLNIPHQNPVVICHVFVRILRLLRATMAEIFVTCCPRCPKQFKSRKALEKHHNQKHPGYDIPESLVFSSGEKEAPIVQPRLLKSSKDRATYMEWLAELVECINSAHNPCVPGKFVF